MTTDVAYELLGLPQGATFEQVMQAKNKILQGAVAQDETKKAEVEAAYDVLLMKSMKQRLAGGAEVASSVRYADVPAPKSPRQVAQGALSKLPGEVSLYTLSDKDASILAAGFGALAVWAVLAACLENPADAAADSASLQLAVALGSGIYTIRTAKNAGFARAAGLTAAGLLAGTLIGAGVEAWLRVDLVPIGPFASPGVLVSEFSILGIWAAAAFLG